MPQGHDGNKKVGAIVFSHGYRGSAAGIMRNKSLTTLASDLGVALIATKSKGDDWDIPGAPRKPGETGAAEMAYFEAMLDDAARRFPIDRTRLMATGFSAGGMMVWNLICQRSDLFAGFLPIAGTFWTPEPQSCSSPPASVIHIHGDADRTVPLAGRAIADTSQGDVAKVLDMYVDYGAYSPAEPTVEMDMACQLRSNADGMRLDFCLFEGGHSFRAKYVAWGWEQFEKSGQL